MTATVLKRLLLATSVVFASSALAQAETSISGPGPFGNCTADDVADQEGINYPGAEVEPWLAANPKNKSHLLAGWQQDRWSNGGSRGLVAAVSRDGGVTWAKSVPQGTTLCAGGPFQRASDPWTTIAKDGTAYFMTLAFMNDEDCGVTDADGNPIIRGGDNAMIVNRSTDGGQTWGPPATLVLDNDGQKFNDKNAMLADPTDKRFVYAVWDKLLSFNQVAECPAPQQVKAKSLLVPASVTSNTKPELHRGSGEGHDGVEDARDRMRKLRSDAEKAAAQAKKHGGVIPPDPPSPVPSGTPQNSEQQFTGPSYFVRSVDGGISWRAERLIFDPGPDAQTINNLLEVAPNGDLFDFFTHILPDGSSKIGYVKSVDHGSTFSPVAYAVPDMNVTVLGTILPDEDGVQPDPDTPGDVIPNREELVRDANILFDSAVDPDNGNMYLVWQDGRIGDIDRVAFTMSRNRGRTWATPEIINATPPNANPLREQAFIPSVEVGKDGRVFVTYYDFRNDTDQAGKELADYWAISCNPDKANCTSKSGWGGEQRLTTSSFNFADAPVARGHFLGDYQGLIRAGNDVLSLFGKAIADNVNDMFFTKLARSNRD